MNQFANFRCAIAFVPFRNDRLTLGSRRHKTGKQQLLLKIALFKKEARFSKDNC